MVPFLRLSEQLQQEITGGNYPSILPSISQMVTQYEVGASTVKRAISRLKELNYVQGVQGKCVKVNPLAFDNPFFRKNIVFYIHLTTLTNRFYLQVIDKLRQHLEVLNCYVHIINSTNQLKNCGIIPDVMIIAEVFDEFELKTLEEHCPRQRTVKLNHALQSYCCVGTDNVAAGYMAMEYLHQQCGHQAIGIISSQLSYSYGFCRLRYDGAAKYQQEHKGVELYNYEVNDLSEGQQAAASLLKKHPEISAIFVTMDFIALGVYSYCYAAGLRIPDDISILGFDNREFAPVLLPGLTTFQENVDEISQIIYDRLNYIVNDSASTDSITIKPIIIIRNSVKSKI